MERNAECFFRSSLTRLRIATVFWPLPEHAEVNVTAGMVTRGKLPRKPRCRAKEIHENF